MPRSCSPFLSLICLVAAGCKVGPDYIPPEIVVPDAWHQAAVEGLSEGDTTLHSWWKTLNDPVLDQLIERATEGNKDLDGAFARIQQARAIRGIATGERYPDIDGDGFAARNRLSEDTNPVVLGRSRTDETYGVGARGFWEIDLWGRVSRSIESADASLEASIEDYRDLLVILYADVGLNYVEARTLQERIRYIEENIELQRGTLQLTEDRLEAEIVSELDVRQAEQNLGNTESDLPPLRQALARTIHRLGVLLGEHPAALYELLGEPAPIPDAELQGTGIPAELLRQRPDVRRAERTLAAQTADIGIATAGLYPLFSLNGNMGFEAGSDLLDGGNRFWSFGPAFAWNLFDGGRVRNAIDLEEAQAEEAYSAYEQTVLLALEDVESSLVAYYEEIERRAALERSATASERATELVKELYRTGLTDFQNVLDTERFLALQQDSLAESEGRVIQNLIAIYRALGGGWRPDPAELQEELESQQHGEPIL